MFVEPTGVLKTWLFESGRAVEAQQGFVLSDDQVAMLDDLRAEAARMTHYGPDERDAWVLFTALTHAGHKPAGAADDIDPAVARTRDSVTAIAKASHAVASVVKDLPATFADLGGLADTLNESRCELQHAADACASIHRELERALTDIEATADRAAHVSAAMSATLDGATVATARLGDIAAKFPQGPVYVMAQPWWVWVIVALQVAGMVAVLYGRH